MDKVPAQYTFLDLSDYARPVARRLVQVLPQFVTPIHLTLAFTAVGAVAAALFALDRWLPLAGVCLLLKSTLDAADGSLARARGRPSRVGRFLDSVCDFIVTVLVFAGIALGEARRTGTAPWALAAAAALSATLQCSVFSYYYVRYRAQTGGDQTSLVHETLSTGEAADAGDNPAALAFLFRAYQLIYGWQDRLMAAVDGVLAPNADVPPRFLTATTVMGLGTQLLVIAIWAVLGRPIVALGSFVTIFNAYWAALLIFRYARRRPSSI